MVAKQIVQFEAVKKIIKQCAKSMSIADYTEVLDEIISECEARLDCLKNEHGSV